MIQTTTHINTTPETDNTPDILEVLCFARSVIQSGEEWSNQCEEIIGGAIRREKNKTRNEGHTANTAPLKSGQSS